MDDAPRSSIDRELIGRLNLRVALMLVMFLLPYALGYVVYWIWSFSTVAIVALILDSEGVRGLRKVGIRGGRKVILLTAVLFIATLYVATRLIPDLLARAMFGYLSVPGPVMVQKVFHAFNEELISRGWLLPTLSASPYLAARFPGRPRQLRAAVSMVTAAGFSLAHDVANLVVFGVSVPVLGLFNLFLFGLAANVAYIRTGTILYFFAIHGAWSVIRFGGWPITVWGAKVGEAYTYRFVESTFDVTCLAMVAMVLALVLPSAGQRE